MARISSLETDLGKHHCLASQGMNRFVIEKLLIKHGVQVDFADNSGQTSLSWAMQNRHHIVINLLIQNWQEALMSTLIEAGAAKFDFKDSGGANPLLCTARKGNVTIVKTLAEAGAEIDSKAQKLLT